MSRLEDIRKEIDTIDRQMAALFEQRMRLASEVAAFKRENGLPVLDTAREDAVVHKNLQYLADPALTSYYTDFQRHLMSLSRSHQTALLGQNTVAYQGAEGGFGHQVTQALYPHAQPLKSATFAEVFEAVEAGRAAFGVVPFENSNTGDVAGVLDLCYSHSCYITAMYDLPVTQNLLALPGARLSDIQTAYSHPQALAQSRRFIESLGIKPEAAANTAVAAKQVAGAGDIHTAAIGSREAAALYGLQILAEDIATEADNTTRFIIISKQPAQEGDRFSLLVTIENKIGMLEKVIGAISAEGLNMESIKSRPMPKRPWEYYFYIELNGAPDTEATGALLERIGRVCVSARTLGNYYRVLGG